MHFTSPWLLSASLLSMVLLSGCFEKETPSDDEAAEESAYKAEKAERDEMRKKLSELKAEKKSIEEELEDLTKAVAKKPAIVEEELKLATELEAVRGYSASLGALDAELGTSLEAWRNATRNSFKGVKIPEIVTVDGTKYSDVTIKEVTDANLVFLHSAGEATLPIVELPVGLRKNVIHEATVLAEQGL